MLRAQKQQRSQRMSDDSEHIPSFVEGGRSESASLESSSIQPSFFERLTGLPLVRAAWSRVQNTYENTKDRNQLLRRALEHGEDGVAYSWSCAAGVLNKTGIIHHLSKPLNLADSTAQTVLNKVEEKLPIVKRSPYEIKLMISGIKESKIDQLNSVKESAVKRYREYKSIGEKTIDNLKQNGTDKVQAAMESPYGQMINQKIETGLNSVDSAVDKFLPEGRSHNSKNGLANGTHVNSNGHHNGSTLEHAKQLKKKVARRLSTRVMQNPAVSSVTAALGEVRRTSNGAIQVAGDKIHSGRVALERKAGGLYVSAVTKFSQFIDFAHEHIMKILPVPVQERVNIFLTQSLNWLSSRPVKLPANEHED